MTEPRLRNFLKAISQFVAVFLLAHLCAVLLNSQQPDEASIIRGVDAAVHARQDAIASYTVTEHYAVFRNHDEVHPAAEMTVQTLYRRESGKTYTIQSESGSTALRKLVLDKILESEQHINLPGVRESSWIISANYEMKLKSSGVERVNGRDCFALSISPRQQAPNLIAGTLWIDATNQSIVQLQGTASKSVSHFTGPTQVMRQYAMIDGFAMATHARASSDSFLFGQTLVTIDYTGYQIQVQPAH